MITSKYFREGEFAKCSPACSLQDMDQRLMDKLDEVREMARIPLVLNSAYRSVAHEKKMGRAGTSSHTKGRAVDIRCTTSANRFKVVFCALAVGFRRIGIGKNYVHLDDDPDKPANVIWHYYE